MTPAFPFDDALVRGYERLAACSGILDRINVFPVADADTGTNLKLSLAPLRRQATTPAVRREWLQRAATGNSGNIACAFLTELTAARQPDDLPSRVRTGRDKARDAVAAPRPGTMLTLFDALVDAITNGGWQAGQPECERLIEPMQTAVAATTAMLPDLAQAGVVDAGALGMFIFLETYFSFLFAASRRLRPLTEIFPTGLSIRADWQACPPEDDYCVNTMVRTDADPGALKRSIDGYGNSIVVTAENDRIKLHAHTADRNRLRQRLADLGAIDQWTESATVPVAAAAVDAGGVHIMTDAAGSLTCEDARQLGITLLSSYLTIGERICPETLLDPADLYTAMTAGHRVTTAQASVFERHQSYLNATGSFAAVVYLCVGSAYTGNYQVASRWQAERDTGGRLTVIDSGAASGRLGIVAMATAGYARTTDNVDAVRTFAARALAASRELVFIDTLKYLAAGGRISKTKGFFGNLLHLKPIISPQPEGAARVGTVRTSQEQVDVALHHLARDLDADGDATILVQFTDNRRWVETTVVPAVAARHPAATLLVRPMSLTSGAHMGPGTWAVAYLASTREGDMPAEAVAGRPSTRHANTTGKR